MTESDADYFYRRAEEERLAAEQATHPAARQAHNELAGRYDEMAEAVKRSAAWFEATVAGEPIIVDFRLAALARR